MLIEDGIEQLSMRNIAIELDVSATALYRHFKSKSDILIQLAEEANELFMSGLTKSLSAKNAKDRLTNSLLVLHQFSNEQPEYYLMLFQQHYFDDINFYVTIRKYKKSIIRFIDDRVDECIIQKQSDKSAVVLSGFHLFSAMNGYLLELLDEKKYQYEGDEKAELNKFIEKLIN